MQTKQVKPNGLATLRDAVLGTIKEVAEAGAAGAITSASRKAKAVLARAERRLTKFENDAAPKVEVEKDRAPAQLKR